MKKLFTTLALTLIAIWRKCTDMGFHNNKCG
jgi:hypothetical protein